MTLCSIRADVGTTIKQYGMTSVFKLASVDLDNDCQLNDSSLQNNG